MKDTNTTNRRIQPPENPTVHNIYNNTFGAIFFKPVTRSFCRQNPFGIVLILLLLSTCLSGMDFRITGKVYENEPQEIESLLREAENQFLPLFKLNRNQGLVVYVCRDLQEFVKLTGASWWNGGHFCRNTIFLQRLEPLREKGIIGKTITHEFLHYCIWKVAGNNCPVWLNEGLVMHLNTEVHQMDCPKDAETFPASVDRLDELLHSTDYATAGRAYCQAAFLVKDILNIVKFDDLLLALQKIKSGNSEDLNSILKKIIHRIPE